MSRYFSVTSIQNGRARDLPARPLSHPTAVRAPSILSTCLPSQKVGALQFLRAPAGDGIKEPTVEVAAAGGSPVSKRRQHAVCAASTRLKIMYNSPTYIYAHRLPETSRVFRRNGKKIKESILKGSNDTVRRCHRDASTPSLQQGNFLQAAPSENVHAH